MSTKKLKRIKYSQIERQLTVSMAGLRAGAAIMGNDASSWWMSKEKKAARRKQVMAHEASRFVDELGKLKGSYVKIGQMLALYGDHLLPPELTDALHRLEHQTAPLEWAAIEPVLVKQLGEKLNELDVEPDALAAASLGQVHKATIRRSGHSICLKVQYPGIQKAIDSDFVQFVRILRMSRWMRADRDLDDLLDEIRSLLHQEVDYHREARMTSDMRHRLAADDRFQVPEVFPRYSTGKVLALEYLPGLAVTDEEIRELPIQRRNRLAQAMLDLLLLEIFNWGVFQTDPNFGNYRIDLSARRDLLILLDFGAVRTFSRTMIDPLRETIAAAHHNNLDAVIDGLTRLNCIQKNHPAELQVLIAEVCMGFLEPLRYSYEDVPAYAVSPEGNYRWAQSELLKRAGKRALKSANTLWFRLPPKEFALVTRKLSGVFSFICAIGAEFRGYPLLDRHVREWQFAREASKDVEPEEHDQKDTQPDCT
jgi:predicted unusual protein kinase regulating ubiquinone biosynthesis (AarF/ABC1/UbiB family)